MYGDLTDVGFKVMKVHKRLLTEAGEALDCGDEKTFLEKVEDAAKLLKWWGEVANLMQEEQ